MARIRKFKLIFPSGASATWICAALSGLDSGGYFMRQSTGALVICEDLVQTEALFTLYYEKESD